MKKIILLLITFLCFFTFACGDSGGGDTVIIQTVSEDEEEPVVKTYIINAIPEAQFYYYTESGTIYKYDGINLERFHITATVQQEGEPDTTENITPVDFYKLGDVYNFEFLLNEQTVLLNQYDGDIYEVEKLYRRPDKIRREMNNGRFSITTGTAGEYTISDIVNITQSSGPSRTLLCIAYYIGSYTDYHDYGLWFVTVDDISLESGLYFYDEMSNAPTRVIDSAGEMWN